jgi:endoglucanase
MRLFGFLTLTLLLAVLSFHSSCSSDAGPSDGSSLDVGLPDFGIVNPLLPPIPLSTKGRFIVDAKSNRVRLSGFNWNGAEGPDYAIGGLDTLERHAIAASLRNLGFNSIRLVWSNELIEKNPVVAAERLAANPDLVGRTALEVMDAVVAALAEQGIMVIMNNHISDAIWCCESTDDNILWYNNRFPERSWLADWRFIAERYKGQPAVIGADLRNEPRLLATWGDGLGRENDWAAAAERAGKAIQEVAPHWLIIVEGVAFASDLTLAAKRPIRLPKQDMLVYSVHDYPWFHKFDNTAEDILKTMKYQWGHLIEDGGPNNVPIWLGEVATCNGCINDGSKDAMWFGVMSDYIREKDLDWSWWRLTGDCGWGFLDPKTAGACSEDLMNAFRTMMKPTQGPGTGGE